MRTFIKVFTDKSKLEEMLRLRAEGWTYVSLGLIYGVDFSSIYKWCQIKKVPRNPNIRSIDLSSIIGELGIEPQREKTYEDYLNDERRKKSILARIL